MSTRKPSNVPGNLSFKAGRRTPRIAADIEVRMWSVIMDASLRVTPDAARQMAQILNEQADEANRLNGVGVAPHQPQNLLIGSRISDDGSPMQVAVIPTFGPAFYTDAAGARHLASRLLARAEELDGVEAEAPLPEPCPLCNGTSRATYNPFEDQFDPGGQDACPICSPEDPR